MKPKTVIVVVLLGFVAVSVGYLIVKEVRSAGAAAPRPAAPASDPALAAGGGPAVLPVRGTTAVPPPATDASAEPVPPAEADGKVVTVYWFYDNKH